MTPAEYSVRVEPLARQALRETAAYIQQDSGPERAAKWLRSMRASIGRLRRFPLAFPVLGQREGVTFRSKVSISHRIYYLVDEAEKTVYVVDVVHTARETRLDRYRSSTNPDPGY